MVLLLAVSQSAPGHLGQPNWTLVLLFAGYNLVADRHLPRLRGLSSFAGRAVLDLPLAGLVYVLSSELGGPAFVLYFLVVVGGAASMGQRAGLVYTVIAAALLAAIEPTLPLWSPAAGDARGLSARVVMLDLVGVGTALVTQRMVLEQAVGRSMRDEAERRA